MPQVDLFGDSNVPKGTEVYDKRIAKIQAEIHNYLRQGLVPGAVQQVIDKLDNISIDADSVNLNTDQLEAKLDTLNALVTTLQADTALIKPDVDVIAAGLGTDGQVPTSNRFVKIGGHQDGSNSVEHIAHVSAGGALKVDNSDVTQPVSDRGATGEATVTTVTYTVVLSVPVDFLIKSATATRKLLAIYNEGPGTLYVIYGSGTPSSSNYSVRLDTKDYLEIEKYTGEIRGIYLSAGSAKVTQII
jgi:hypothetical protein